jgi:hypothetical protein
MIFAPSSPISLPPCTAHVTTHAFQKHENITRSKISKREQKMTHKTQTLQARVDFECFPDEFCSRSAHLDLMLHRTRQLPRISKT